MLDPHKPPQTLPELAQRSFVTHAARPCLGIKPADANKREASDYVYATYGEVAARVKNIAGGLLALGLERGQRAAILSENRPEWAIADLACQMIGVVSVSLFSTLPPNQVAYILKDSGAALIFVSNASQAKKVEAVRDELPDLKHVIVMDGEENTFAQLEEQGAKYHAAHATEYEATWPASQPDDLATLIYTSGTTGEPKGVMLTQRNLTSNVEAILGALKQHYGMNAEEVFLSFLPLAHVYERTAGFLLAIRIGAAIAYVESLGTLDKNMREAHPTFMFCVPRLYESIRDKLQDGAKSLPADKQKAYDEALKLAVKAGMNQGVDGAQGLSFGEKVKFKVFDHMVYSQIRARFGGRLRAFVSGGAPMTPELGALFTGLSLPVLQGYGLTETSPVIAVNRPGRVKLATVGEALDGVEVQIAPDGEILTRSSCVMRGYWEKPEATREALDSEGWFHTGDLGELKGGYLQITGRKKDLLVLANGKKVAPQPIELKLMESRLISQAVLLGDGQKAVVALIVPDKDELRRAAKFEGDDEALLASPQAREVMRVALDDLTQHLADFEKVRAFHLLNEPFTVESGELTPTLKVKRPVVQANYAHLLD